MNTRNAPQTARLRGFTLVELLAVIGIIVLLVAIAVPVISSARRNADRARTQLDLQAISMALNAYKLDFKDYPRPPKDRASDRVLAWALIGPFRQDTAAPLLGGKTAKATSSPGQEAFDGAPGPGFRTQWSTAAGGTGGKVWGPYLPIDKFKLSDDLIDLLDHYGAPIEYFPRWRVPPRASAGTAIKLFDFPGKPGNAIGDGVYDWHHADRNAVVGSKPKAVMYFERALGDLDGNNQIDPAGNEQLAECPDFLLISRGSGGDYEFSTEIEFLQLIGLTAATRNQKKGDLTKLSTVTNLP